MKITKAPPTRINVALPEDLLQDLRKMVPARKRNQFVVALIERELRHRRLLQVLEETRGAWSAQDHPELESRDDVDRYVRQLRATWTARSWDEMLEEGQSDDRTPAGHQHSDLILAQ